MKRALRILSALMSMYLLSELFTEIKLADTNVLIALVYFMIGSCLGLYAIFGSGSILSNRKSLSLEFSEEIRNVADKAITIAGFWGHSSVSIEHLLLALLKDEEVALIVNEFGGEIKGINDSINVYFEKEIKKNQYNEESEIKISDEVIHAFRKAMNRSFASSTSSNNLKKITSGYILASLLENENTISYRILNENNIRRFEVLKWLSSKSTEIRGFRKIENIPLHDRDGIWKVIIYNDDFTEMEFVYSLLIGLFNKSKKRASEMVLDIHKKGLSTCGKYKFIEAVNIMKKVNDLSNKNEYPLMCSIEKHRQE